MSKTIRVRIETTARIVISKETEVAVLAERAKLLVMKERYPEKYAELSGSRKALVATLLIDDFNIEDFVKTSVRGGIREFTREDLCREFSQEGLKFDRAQAKVTFE
ncbi:hypothetical protein X917_gp28 [Pseudomonas phage PPpW-4]|uniref:Uncharacterized protein n=1 Tax=Pseudomonas phage PPpW-4 TaxID=1279083 RepID=V5YTU1_9CAUD|nr:hypothetical protein X917_gp28 [Pseudomonas phage PPpW-4]BAO20694.1 hypothetical protein [Pseudomonas phage PPpW-4]